MGTENQPLIGAAGVAIRILAILWVVRTAFDIRTFALKTYGYVIHEFDPWFNYRATEFLAEHGWAKFLTWYDYMVWYPLGRPIGTTIYPGMQVASVTIWNSLNAAGYEITLNDVCCLVPCWFGVCASLFVGLIAYECSKSANAGVMAAMIMAIIPAHIMRSVGGGYDNESVAMTCLTGTFYFWIRSLRDANSWPYAVIGGIFYFFMVATWGGYIFVINLIGVHALVMYLAGIWSRTVHKAYTIFYVIGTLGAIQVPIVGLAPLKSFEQLGPFGVFVGYQLLYYIDVRAIKEKMDADERKKLFFKVATMCAAAGAVVIAVLMPTGYFGPLSSRVRGLFVQHTRTGNPLVDSVAEHQPTSPQAYYQFLNIMCYYAPMGFLMSARNTAPGNTFLLTYAGVAYYVCSKMSRLVVLLGPVGSALGGICLGFTIDWMIDQWTTTDEPVEASKPVEKKGSKKGGKKKKDIDEGRTTTLSKGLKPFFEMYKSQEGIMARKGASVLFAIIGFSQAMTFYQYCYIVGEQMSGPSIMYKATLQSGEQIIVDDYREAYHWLRDNTDADARVMAWWDYGYQITGIANRTSIADGNTWNHEHIATLGRALSAPEKDAHDIVRHMADYVLVWAGGGGDDLAKSPHMARIGNSVYNDICPKDPTCRKFGFTDQQMTPTPMMEKSLLYRLHSGNQYSKPGVTVDAELFENVFNSKYGKVRIWKVLNVDEDSKAWVADPANRKCDPPGSWQCAGQYPPAMQAMGDLQNKKAFRQLEDFNADNSDEDSEKYTKEYMARMGGH